MDISSLYGSSALDSTAYTNAANQTASKIQNQVSGADYTKATDDELDDVESDDDARAAAEDDMRDEYGDDYIDESCDDDARDCAIEDMKLIIVSI